MAKHDMNPVNSSSPESGATVRGGGTRTSEDQAQNGAGGGKGPGNNNIATCFSYRLIWNSSVNHKINPIETPCMLITFTYCLAFMFYHNIQTYVICLNCIFARHYHAYQLMGTSSPVQVSPTPSGDTPGTGESRGGGAAWPSPSSSTWSR